MRRAVPPLLGVTLTVASIACSLGLDPSKLDGVDGGPPREGGGPGIEGGGPGADAAPVDGARPDAPLGEGGPLAGACTTNQDCTSTIACLRGRCDLPTRTCFYDACPQAAACTTATCAPTGQCSAPVRHDFRAATFTVGSRAQIACGGSLARCFAAVWPYLFVGTTGGLVAYQVGDPASPAPPSPPVTGLPFLPQHLAVSGRRLYAIGAPTGTAPDFRLPVAWIDVPGDPFAPALAARAVFVTYPHPSVAAVYPAPDGGVFLVHGDGSKLYPTGILRAPFADFAPVATFPLAGMPAGHSPVASSGARLVTYRHDASPSALAPFFAQHAGAGTNASQSGAEQVATAMVPVASQVAFAIGPDGSVLLLAAQQRAVDGGMDLPAVRAAWVLPDGTSALDPAAKVDVAAYTPGAPVGAPLVGGVALMDARRALLATALPEDRAQTMVQVLSRAQTPPTILAGRRFAVAAAPNAVAVTGSEGYGYALAPEAPDGLRVHTFAPSCPP